MKRLRNIIRYLIIIALDVLIMLSFHSYINFILLIGLLLFPVYSIYGVYKVQQMFTFEIKAPLETMHKKETFQIRFLLHNPTSFPLLNTTVKLKIENAFYEETGMHVLNIPARAKADTEILYPIVMEQCGCFQVKAEQVTFVDLLGIWEVSVPLEQQGECLVMPNGMERNEEAGRIYIKGVSEAMETKEKGYDFSDVSGIREYIPGDKLQNIHWKLSMKKDELMVKERVSVSAMQLNVLVELINDEEMCLESILELADSITKSFVMQNFPFTVFYYSSNLGELKSCYIGNEIERIQWMEMMLYDQYYQDDCIVEELFLKQNTGGTGYLYIGRGTNVELGDNAIPGENQVVAELRRND